ncbi:hypothetical protein [Nonomuraea cavernae]|uniref:DUF3558 domain-containing protein n=1 Tax=Nonomuraea cavernae TaxID=2045107 RepID=A0A917Z8X5_9ACTN|nr:hypothetical protein [Nonomuraea cavernae]MCA2189287.1 hypothetical protein [Nonomuraea cavernae]GGO76479.1 hypothetical protein GCM10012289_53910 [Nonomuraea cavernae]
MNPNQPDQFPTVAVQRTAPTQQSRPGLRVTPVILGTAMTVVVLMLFTVVFLLTREPEPARSATPAATPPSQAATAAPEPSPREQSPTSEPAPTGPATITKEADPCALADEDLVKKLTLYPDDKSQIRADECEWSTLPRGASLPDNMSFQLRVYVKVFPGDVAAAHEQHVAQRREAMLLARDSTPADPPVGDSSWTTRFTMPGGTGNGPTTATVGVRVSNAVIQVVYQRRVPEDPSDRLTKGALEMATAIAAKLGTGD